MNAQKFFLIICVLICLCLPCAVSAQDNDLPENWWDNNTLIAKGYGSPPKHTKDSRRAKIMARRAAIMDGYRQLAEQTQGINITAETTVESQIVSGDIVKSKVDAVLKGATILSEEYDKYNCCKVTMSVPIFGVEDSIAKVAFKPVAKEDFPTPTKEFKLEGNYTGLIIDCGDADLKPVLLPVIRSEDNIAVYSYSNLDYEKVVSKGMVTYAKGDGASYIPLPRDVASKVETLPLRYDVRIKNTLWLATNAGAATNISRAGDNPLIIKATGMSDDNSCPIISADDADRILAENQASHFLDNGSVVFTSYRVGGLRV